MTQAKGLQRVFISHIDEWSRKRPLSLLGPTGSGKTSALLKYLKQNSNFSPLLVSLDSVAAYTELDIGSSKPRGSDLSDFRWCGINIVPPTLKMNASLMKRAIMPELEKSPHKNEVVFVGGTHFYERFILEGAAPGEASDPQYLEELKSLGNVEVYNRLCQKDEKWKSFLHVNDEFRVFRYADLVLRQGLDYELLRGGSLNPLYPEIECLILEADKSELESKLSYRIEEMFKDGWIDEVQSLLKKYSSEAPALNTVGYKEIVDFLKEPAQDLDTLKGQILIRHRQLAKQQRTWLRSLLRFR